MRFQMADGTPHFIRSLDPYMIVRDRCARMCICMSLCVYGPVYVFVSVCVCACVCL